MSARGRPELSVIVPAYNEEARIRKAVVRLAAYLKSSGWRWELIVVDDGSIDATPRILASLAAKIPRLKIEHSRRNRGKGAAVRQGLAAARGRTIVFTDCDLSTPPSELRSAVRWIAGGHDLAFATRTHPESRIPSPSPLRRRLASRIFNRAVQIILGLPHGDTQCGFKAFSRKGAAIMVREGLVDGYAFDIEFLMLARRHRLPVTEFPITWRDSGESKVDLMRHAPGMFASLISLRRRFSKVRGFHPAQMLPLIFVSVLAAITAQILFKQGAMNVGARGSWADFAAGVWHNPQVWLGIATYGVGATAWLVTLARVELSFAFPMLSMGFVFASLYAHLFLGEHLALLRIVGIGLLILGVILISMSGAPTEKKHA